jgi:hypothetical protein
MDQSSANDVAIDLRRTDSVVSKDTSINCEVEDQFRYAGEVRRAD